MGTYVGNPQGDRVNPFVCLAADATAQQRPRDQLEEMNEGEGDEGGVARDRDREVHSPAQGGRWPWQHPLRLPIQELDHSPRADATPHTRPPSWRTLSHWHLSPPQSSLYIAVTFYLSPNMSMESRLAQVAGLNQKDKATAYQSILTDLLARPDQTTLAHDLHILVENVVQESTGLVIGRQVLSELVKALEAGIVADVELRKQIVQDTLDIIQPRIVSYEEQVCRTSWNILGCHFLTPI